MAVIEENISALVEEKITIYFKGKKKFLTINSLDC